MYSSWLPKCSNVRGRPVEYVPALEEGLKKKSFSLTDPTACVGLAQAAPEFRTSGEGPVEFPPCPALLEGDV